MEQMTQLTSMCEMVCQIFQKKREEKRIEEEQAANARYWKIPACCDDDDDDDDVDYTIAITPVLSTEETKNSVSMGDEHLDTIPATESDEVIKSSVEDLVPISSESEGIRDTMSDVHLVNNSTPLEAKDHFKIVINSNDDISSSDDDSLYNENIEYVETSPHDSELVSLEAAEIVIPEVEEIEDDNLREKLDGIPVRYDNKVFKGGVFVVSSMNSPLSARNSRSIFWGKLMKELIEKSVVAALSLSTGDPLQVKVNKLSSTKTQLPYKYHYLSYCKTTHIQNSVENLGEFHMREELSCKVSCKVKVDAQSTKNF
nr:transmembrane 9 superfamily member 7-like [Tanacetum cinerariifolium]